jgi:hypothetical protein
VHDRGGPRQLHSSRSSFVFMTLLLCFSRVDFFGATPAGTKESVAWFCDYQAVLLQFLTVLRRRSLHWLIRIVSARFLSLLVEYGCAMRLIRRREMAIVLAELSLSISLSPVPSKTIGILFSLHWSK